MENDDVKYYKDIIIEDSMVLIATTLGAIGLYTASSNTIARVLMYGLIGIGTIPAVNIIVNTIQLIRTKLKKRNNLKNEVQEIKEEELVKELENNKELENIKIYDYELNNIKVNDKPKQFVLTNKQK